MWGVFAVAAVMAAESVGEGVLLFLAALVGALIFASLVWALRVLLGDSD